MHVWVFLIRKGHARIQDLIILVFGIEATCYSLSSVSNLQDTWHMALPQTTCMIFWGSLSALPGRSMEMQLLIFMTASACSILSPRTDWRRQATLLLYSTELASFLSFDPALRPAIKGLQALCYTNLEGKLIQEISMLHSRGILSLQGCSAGGCKLGRCSIGNDRAAASFWETCSGQAEISEQEVQTRHSCWHGELANLSFFCQWHYWRSQE